MDKWNNYMLDAGSQCKKENKEGRDLFIISHFSMEMLFLLSFVIRDEGVSFSYQNWKTTCRSVIERQHCVLSSLNGHFNFKTTLVVPCTLKPHVAIAVGLITCLVWFQLCKLIRYTYIKHLFSLCICCSAAYIAYQVLLNIPYALCFYQLTFCLMCCSIPEKCTHGYFLSGELNY